MPPSLQISGKFVVRKAIDLPQGAFARVYLADDLEHGSQVAFKVMREEHLSLPYKEKKGMFRAFLNEADLLTELTGDPNVMQLHGLGYLTSESHAAYAPIVCDNHEEFSARLDEAIAHNWRPYLALELLPSEDSLFRLVNQNFLGLRLPTEEALTMSLQLAELFVRIHQRGIVYWDAKPEHAYWLRSESRVVLIDWNVSRRLGPREGNGKKQMDIVHLAQGILYPAFVGLDFQTGQAPSPKPTSSFTGVAARYELGQSIAFYGQDKWLDAPIKDLLRRASSVDGIPDAEAFVKSVQQCAVVLGWVIDGFQTNERARAARAQTLVGLKLLLQSQSLINQAILHFEQAEKELPPYNAEIQRLIDESLDSFSHRVIP